MIYREVSITDKIDLVPVDADEGLVGIRIAWHGYRALSRDEVDRLIEALEEARA